MASWRRDKCQHWIANKRVNLKKMARSIFISCLHYVFDCTLCLVIDDVLHGWTKSLDFDYFFVKDLVSKYCDQLKEAISSGKAQIIKEASGWRNDVKCLYHLTHVFRHFIEKQHEFSL